MKNRLKLIVLLVALFCVSVLPHLLAGPGDPATGVDAGPSRYAERVKKISSTALGKLRDLTTLRPEALMEVDSVTDAARLQARTAEIMALDSLYVGARKVDGNGEAAIHRYLKAEIARVPELELLGTLKGSAVVPVAVDKLMTQPAEAPSQVAIAGKAWSVSPMWPNGAMPSLCPKGGLTGPLVYVGDGSWENIRGIDLKGSIALMDFQGGRQFERLFSLGCQAVIVVEDDRVMRENAESLFCNTPVPCPRFYVTREVGKELIAHAARQQVAGSTTILPGEPCTLTGGALYEPRPFESLFAYLPPTDPIVHVVKQDGLLSRIATEFGTDVTNLKRENAKIVRDGKVTLKEGDTINIPGRTDTYKVKKDDLLERLAADYGVKKDDILKASKLKAEDVVPGAKLVIPNVDESIVIAVPIDTVSVAPDLPHGARVASNLAVALTMMEHMATSKNTVRRKGVVFAFMDAEAVGGLSSRALAEYTLISANRLTAYNVENTSDLIKRYEGVRAWFSDANAPMGDADAQWLAETWLMKRVEDLRVSVAEERIPYVNKVREANDAAEAARKQGNAAEEAAARARADEYGKKQAEAEAKLQFIIGLREATLGNKQASYRESLQQFRSRLQEAETQKTFPVMPLTFAALTARFNTEVDQLLFQESTRDNNLKLVGMLWDKLHNKLRDKDSNTPIFDKQRVVGWYLDFSSGSGSIGIKSAGTDFRAKVADADLVKNYNTRFADVTAYAYDTAGWDNPWAYIIAEEDSKETAILPTEAPPTYAEFWAADDVSMLALGTMNDRMDYVDTPHDTADRVDYANLGVQARTALVLLKLGLESPTDSYGSQKQKRPQYSRAMGEAQRFNIRSGVDDMEPVPGVLVYYPGTLATEPNPRNTSTYRGVRKGIMMISLLSGRYSMPLEICSKDLKNNLFAFHLDRDTALFDRAVDQGQIGTQKKTPLIDFRDGFDVEKNLILTDVYPWVFFPEPDPVDYAAMGDSKDGQDIRILDAMLNGEPQHYAFINPTTDYNEADVLSNTIYMPKGRHVRLNVQKSTVFKVILTGAITAEHPKGEGYIVGPTDDGDRNLTLPMTTLVIARDMQQLATTRHRTYQDYGISDRSVSTSMDRSQEKLQEAETALAAKDWQKATGAAREGWGILVKVYPRILTLGREAVFSVVILMALLLPACIFLEKLIIGSKTIVAQLGGSIGLFVLGVVFLNVFHPAFKISVSPFIVMISFTMILMSLVVLSISYSRFDVLVRRARAAAGEVEGEEISLASSLGTALSLGVSNLKKRPARTFLTTLTVSVLTFSIITFVSVKGADEVFQRSIPLDTDLYGMHLPAQGALPNTPELEVQKPGYSGVVFRNFYWSFLPDTFVSAIYSEYGAQVKSPAPGQPERKAYELTTRGFYIQTEGGNNMDREGVNQIQVKRGKDMTIITGLMGFMPNEVHFSTLPKTLAFGTWFRSDADRFVTILPQEVANALKITKDAICNPDGSLKPDDQLPVVTMQNRNWRVIGVLDTPKADLVRDATGTSLAMVDWRRSGFSSNAASGDLVNEQTGYYKGWKEFAIIPMTAKDDALMKARSVAIKFANGDDAKAFFADAKLRLNRAMFYANENGECSLVTTTTANSVGGLAKIIVPVILCILIVLNTMLGTVDERKGEVAMLGAIGLSPAQISFLLLSESAVFSVLGIIFGTFAGLLFGWITAHTGAFSGLSVNFTSLSSIALAMGTGVVVLVATLIPARKAAAMAAPSGMEKWELPEPEADMKIHFNLPFTLTRGNAVGMMAFFRRFLLNHSEATSEDFNCRNIRLGIEEGEEPSLTIVGDMWLAPYDLDVAQHLHMRVYPTENEGVFSVVLVLERTSGTEEAWMRTNYGFMNLVRHQFLLWRNLDNQSRLGYIAEGAKLFQEAGN